MNRAVVTGSAGFIGSHLTEQLLGADWSVVGIDCFSPTYNTSRRRSLIGAISENPAFELSKVISTTSIYCHT